MNDVRKRSFVFDGIDFHKHRWFIGTIGDVDLEFQFGFDRSVNVSDTGAFPVTLGVTDSLPVIEFTVVQMGYGGEPLPVDIKKYNELAKLLYRTEPRCLEIAGMTYTGVFKGLGEGIDTGINGYIKLSFQLSVPYAMANKISYSRVVSGKRIIEVNNISTANGYDVYPDIIFTLTDMENSFTIRNLSTGDKIGFGDLEENGKYLILGEQKQVFNMYDIDEIIYSDSWIKLNYGINRIEVSGEGIIDIQFNPKMGLTPII